MRCSNRAEGTDGASGGERQHVPALLLAAAAAGADGFFLETHPDPDRALSDADTQWPLDELEALLMRDPRCLACRRVTEVQVIDAGSRRTDQVARVGCRRGGHQQLRLSGAGRWPAGGIQTVRHPGRARDGAGAADGIDRGLGERTLLRRHHAAGDRDSTSMSSSRTGGRARCPAMTEMLLRRGLGWEEVAFLGDDWRTSRCSGGWDCRWRSPTPSTK